jgi:hypothetical protein
MPRSEPWLPKDDKDLTKLVETDPRAGGSLNWTKLKKRFPNRTRWALLTRMSKLGLGQPKPWTDSENILLEGYWNQSPKETILKLLPGRTWGAIYDHATRVLHLSSGSPPGMISLSALEKDPSWGYGRKDTKRIIQEGGVRIRCFNYSGKKPRGVPYVVLADVLEAAKRWSKEQAIPYEGKEHIRDAAKRLHVNKQRLRGWLVLEGIAPPVVPKQLQKIWVVPETYDQVVAKYRSSDLAQDPRPVAQPGC